MKGLKIHVAFFFKCSSFLMYVCACRCFVVAILFVFKPSFRHVCSGFFIICEVKTCRQGVEFKESVFSVIFQVTTKFGSQKQFGENLPLAILSTREVVSVANFDFISLLL